jgi:HAD superfamily hydrolase (TIGR01450 family)
MRTNPASDQQARMAHARPVLVCGNRRRPDATASADWERTGRACACQTAAVLWLLDLDGVVWLTGRPIGGAPEAIQRLRQAGEQVAFLTNNSGPTVADHVAGLRAAGVDAKPDEVLTSAHAAASLLPSGSTAAVVGGAGIFEALAERGVRVVPLLGPGNPGAAPGGPSPSKSSDAPDAVVVGRTTELSYELLAAASSAIRAGARYVATNADATLPTPEGPEPGAGAIVAFIQVAAGVTPEIAGKPHPAAAAFVKERLGPVGVVVGDRPDTDGRFAGAVGAPFALVLSGVTARRDLPVDPKPDVIGRDLAAVVDQLLGEAPR